MNEASSTKTATRPDQTVPWREITVKYSGGAYATTTVSGQRASSTSSAQMAALKLAQKLYGVGAAALFIRSTSTAVYVYRVAPSMGALS